MKKTARIFLFIVIISLFAIVSYYLYDTFRERTDAEKLAEIIHLEDRRLINTALLSYLSDGSNIIRAKAALAIGRIGSPESGRILYDLLEDNSQDVAASAMFAIGLTNETEYASKILDVAFDLPAKVGMYAVEAAGRLADSSMTDVAHQLVQFFSHPAPEVRQAAMMALFRAGAKSKADDLINHLTSGFETDEDAKVTGMYVLARMGNIEAKEIYISMLSDADSFARAMALRGLGAVKDDEAINYLGIALNDSDRKVVAQAIFSLGSIKSAKAKNLLSKKMETETEENLLILLLNSMSRQENESSVLIAELLINENISDNIVAAAINYIASINREKAVSLIDSLGTVGGSFVKAACADAYGKVGTEKIISRLSRLFNDEDPLVRYRALSNLFKIDTSNFDFYIKTALNDKDEIVVVHAINEISEKQYFQYLPVMMTMISMEEEASIEIRRSILEAVETFLKENNDDSLAMKILINGAIDKEYIIRKEAARIYREVLKDKQDDIIRRPTTYISEGEIEDAIEKYTTNPYATILTSKGEIEMEIYFDSAPLTAMNFISLAQSDYYDGLGFHRIVPNFVVQGGDPRGDGWGGPDYFIRCEYSDEKYLRGTVGIATSGKDTGGSQFFFTLSPQPHLEGRYTVFGQVLSGMEVVDNIVPGDIIEDIIILENPF